MDSKELRAQLANLWEQNKALLDSAEKDERGFSAEEQETWDKRDADMVALEARIKNQESVEDREKRAFREVIEAGLDEHEPGTPEARAVEYATAFRSYVKRGETGISDEERSILSSGAGSLNPTIVQEERAQSITTSGGGYMIPQGFYDQLIVAQKRFGGVRSVSNVFQTDSGNPLPIPTNDDTSNTGELLAINTQAASQDLAFGQVTLGAYVFSSKVVLVPIQLMQDSAFDENTWLAPRLGERVARIQNTKYTLGTATVEPQGVVVGAANAGTAATGSVSAWTVNDLIDLEHSIDPAYRGNASWMFHDTGLKKIKQLKDAQGRPLWLPGLATGDPSTINGYPYTINQDVAVPASAAKAILFGDFRNYFIREVRGFFLFRFNERFMESLQVGFLGYARSDAAMVDAGTHPVKYLVNNTA